MPSPSTHNAGQTRTYDRASSVVFLKTDEPFGGLSNMAGGFPLWVNGIRILTSEALYQACRFPHRPEVQALIIEQKSPMTAKMKSKPYRHDSRPDWDQVRVKIMRWCLRVKLAQNWRAFSELLLETGERPIVEESRKDAFWGAKVTDEGTLVGMNVLGRLLMELREAVRVEGRESLMSVQPLAIPDFRLGGRPIQIVTSQVPERDVESGKAVVTHYRGDTDGRAFRQPSLFDESVVKEAPSAGYAAVRAEGVHVADLKPYSEYKESGSTWLGAVPVAWEVRNLRTLISKRAERDRADLPLLSVAREKGVFVRSLTDADENHNVIPEDLSNYKVARAGNLVINKMKAWQGSMGIAPCDGIVSPAYFVFDFCIANHAFGQRLLRSKPYVAHFGQASDGVRVGQWDLSIPGMRQIPVLVPPPEEQAAIVRFLDWANGRLEQAIRAKRKVIALLNEQKQAIVHRAVTCGLDPSFPLKPSESRWFPGLPAGWDALTLRRVITSAIDGPHFSPRYQDAGIPFLSARNVRADRWILSDAKYISEADYIEFSRRVCPVVGDVLYTKGGTTGVARAVDLTFPFQVWVHIAVLKLRRDRMVPEFLAYCLNSPRCYEQAQLFTRGATNQDLGLGRMKDIELPVPPTLGEQNAIVDALNSQCSAFNTAIARLEREIELLREYRTRLIADVVTGKLDVREAALRLPDEAPLDTVEDDAGLSDETEAADEEAAA